MEGSGEKIHGMSRTNSDRMFFFLLLVSLVLFVTVRKKRLDEIDKTGEKND